MNASTTNELVVLNFLQGNEPLQLFPLQLFIQEHFTVIIAIWWTIWISVIVFLISYYIIFPLLQNRYITIKHPRNELTVKKNN